MKTFFKNIGNTIVKKLRKHPLICNFVLSVVLAFVLEVLGRQTFDLSAVGFVDQRSKMFLYSIFIIFVTYSVTLITIFLYNSNTAMEYRWNRKFYDAQFKKYSIYVCRYYVDEVCIASYE